jgi:hypothetical protein
MVTVSVGTSSAQLCVLVVFATVPCGPVSVSLGSRGTWCTCTQSSGPEVTELDMLCQLDSAAAFAALLSTVPGSDDTGAWPPLIVAFAGIGVPISVRPAWTFVGSVCACSSVPVVCE